MQLEWKPPRDDGGMPVTYYIVEKCDESMGGRWTAAGETDGPVTDFKVQVITTFELTENTSVCIKDLDKLDLVKIRNGAPAASNSNTRF